MNTRLLLMVCAFLVAAQVKAGPITGNIQFLGGVQLDSADVNAAGKVDGWSNTTVSVTFGSFTNITLGTPVSFRPPAWSFNSGPVTNFWLVGGFTFNLTSSSIFLQGGGFLNVELSGTVSGNGFNTTVFAGGFSVSDPPIGGPMEFSEIFSFSPVPPPPNLSIIVNGPGSLSILWPTNIYHNYTLQQNSDLATTNWGTANYFITNCLGTNFCIVTPLVQKLYFRLTQ